MKQYEMKHEVDLREIKGWYGSVLQLMIGWTRQATTGKESEIVPLQAVHHVQRYYSLL